MGGWDLIERAKAGDMDAFGEFYRQYYPRVLALLLTRTRELKTRTLPLAEDLTQATFLRVLRGIDSFSDVGVDPMGLLTRIACRLYADYRKSAKFRQEMCWPTVSDSDDETVLRDRWLVGKDELTSSAEETYLRRETADELRSFIVQLGPYQRECVWLRFYEDRSVSETAGVLGIKNNAARGLQHRAVRKLAELMEAA